MDQQVLRGIVEQAARAPSIHNTQPWRFVTRGDVIEVWTDPERGLAVLDPTGRARHLSCGAAILHARVAAADAGYAVDVTILPEPAEPSRLADLRLSPAGAPQEIGLAAAIESRRTHRDAFAPEQLTDEVVDQLREAVETEGCWLRLVDKDDDAVAVAGLLARADEMQRDDPAYREELRRWTAGRRDAYEGVPPEAIPELAPTERGSNYRLRDFVADRVDTPPDRPFGSPAPAEPPPVERPLVAVLGTPGDDVPSWIASGQGLGRLLLTAATIGVAASPLTQPLEVPYIRQRLTVELGLLGHPQMMLRLGYAPAHGEDRVMATPRRPVSDIITEL